jgi:hypothetical protein
MTRSLLIVLLLSIPLVTVLAQTSSPAPTPASSPAAAQPATTPSSADRFLREGMKGMADNSSGLTGWALTLVGASILAIASTSYLRPLSRRTRYIYLLFIPGWFFLALSIYNGNKISRRYTAVTFTQDIKTLAQIGNSMNTEFAAQLSHFQWALFFFSIWLLCYIVWWIFVDLPVEAK